MFRLGLWCHWPSGSCTGYCGIFAACQRLSILALSTFGERSLVLRMGRNLLKFPHATQHLVAMARSQQPPTQLCQLCHCIFVDPPHVLQAIDRVVANSNVANSTPVFARVLKEIKVNTGARDLDFLMLTQTRLLYMPAYHAPSLKIQSSSVFAKSTRSSP